MVVYDRFLPDRVKTILRVTVSFNQWKNPFSVVGKRYRGQQKKHGIRHFFDDRSGIPLKSCDQVIPPPNGGNQLNRNLRAEDKDTAASVL